jgi:hypothetical protein
MRFARTLMFISAVFAALPAGATTIVIRSGTYSGSYDDTVSYTSWTQTGTFSGVTIQAELFGTSSGTATGNAYLMTQVGSGTTSSQQIGATSSISVSNTSPSLVTMFSNLTLGPGAYYVVVANTSEGQSQLAWAGYCCTLTTEVGPGVTVPDRSDGYATTIAAYPPASSNFSTKTNAYFFSATGILGAVSPVPTLSTWAMLATALLLLSSGLMLMKFYRPQE